MSRTTVLIWASAIPLFLILSLLLDGTYTHYVVPSGALTPLYSGANQADQQLIAAPLTEHSKPRSSSDHLAGASESAATRNVYNLHVILQKLTRGEPLIIGAVGGSVTVSNCCLGYVERLAIWLNDQYPVTQPISLPVVVDGVNSSMIVTEHMVVNKAQSASSSFYPSICHDHLFISASQLPRPDLLLFEFGVNDRVIRSDPASKVAQEASRPEVNLERLVRHAATFSRPMAVVVVELGVVVAPRFWDTPLQINDTAAVEMVQQGVGSRHMCVADYYGVPVIDIAQFVRHFPTRELGSILNDAVHFNDDGYVIVSSLVAAELEFQYKMSNLTFGIDDTIESALIPFYRPTRDASLKCAEQPTSISYSQTEVQHPFHGFVEYIFKLQPRSLRYSFTLPEPLYASSVALSSDDGWSCHLGRYGMAVNTHIKEATTRNDSYASRIEVVNNTGWFYGDPRTNRTTKVGWWSKTPDSILSVHLGSVRAKVGLAFLRSYNAIGSASAWFTAGADAYASPRWPAANDVVLQGKWESRTQQLDFTLVEGFESMTASLGHEMDNIHLHITLDAAEDADANWFIFYGYIAR